MLPRSTIRRRNGDGQEVHLNIPTQVIGKVKELLTAGRTRDATRLALGGLRRNPNHSGLLRVVGQSYAADNASSEARRYFNKAIKIAPDDTHTMVDMALFELKMGNNDCTRELLMRALGLKPCGRNIKKGLIKLALSEGDNEMARALAQEIVDDIKELGEKPGPYITNWLATVFMDVGDYAAAIKWFRFTLKNNKNSVSARHGLAEAYIELGELNKAKSILISMRDNNPRDMVVADLLQIINELEISFGLPE